MAKRKFKYRESDPDVTSQHADRKGDYDRVLEDHVKVFTAKEGKNRLRIMPRTWEDDEGPKHWAFPVYLHYGVGPDNGRYPCPNRMGWGPCPMCEERSKMDVDGDKKASSELRPSPSQLCWVIDRNHEEEGPMAFLMPATKLEGPICDLSRDMDTGARLKIEHPELGYDITFTRKGTGRTSTDYSAAAISRKQTFLSEDEKEEEEWLTFIEENPLSRIVKQYDYDYLKQVFGGLKASKRTKDEDEDEEDDAPPPRSRRRGRTKEVDDEDAELDEPESEEEEEVKPKRRRRAEPVEEEPEGKPESGRRRTKATSRGDDDEEEEEEEEKEPEPKRGRRSKLREGVSKGLRSRRRSEE